MSNSHTGLGYGVQGPLRQYPLDTEVLVTRGRQKGRRGLISYLAEHHPLSSERRYAVYMLNTKDVFDRRLILINESGFKVVDK